MKGKEAYEIFESTRLSRKEFCDMISVSTGTLQRWGKKGADTDVSSTIRDRVILAERACKAGKLSLEGAMFGEKPAPEVGPEPQTPEPLWAPTEFKQPRLSPEGEKNLKEALTGAPDLKAVQGLSDVMEKTMDLYVSLKDLKKLLEAKL